MKSASLNLVPSHRRDAYARAWRIRAWSVGGGCYLVLLVLACIVSYAVWGGDQAAVAAQVEGAARQVDEAQRINAKLQPEVNEAQSKLDLIKAVSEQPNWSVLLRLLAKNATDQIVLSSCRLGDATDQPKARMLRAPASQPLGAISTRLLTITGYGRSQAAVSHFVLRLEEAQLFDQVTLIKTSREPFAASDAYAFQIECSLSGGAR